MDGDLARVVAALAAPAGDGLGRRDAATRCAGPSLRPGQDEGVRRTEALLRQHGIALLADPPGTGKTFVALALAARAGGALVVAPAAVLAQWGRRASAAGVPVRLVSLERCSRALPDIGDEPLLVIDEAHHARHRRARRWPRLAALAMPRPTLLLSATPVHHRADELRALLALRLGRRADRSPLSVLSALVVRTADGATLPAIRRRRLRLPEGPDLAATIAAIPAPGPPGATGDAAALSQVLLAMGWSAGLATLDTLCRRRLARGEALCAALAAGERPDAATLRRWLLDGEGVQFALPLSVPDGPDDPSGWEAAIAAHARALRALRARIAPHLARDREARAAALWRVAARAEAPVVAIARLRSTVLAYWRALGHRPGVACLTGDDAWSVSGRWAREEVLRQFRPDGGAPSAARRVRLLLATEVLREGIDLHAAGTLVHLDTDWTPAVMRQREGRVVRAGSPHREVLVCQLPPPAGARPILALAARHRRKRRTEAAVLAAGAGDWGARQALLRLRSRAGAVGGAQSDRISAGGTSADGSPVDSDRVMVAASDGSRCGWLARLEGSSGAVRWLASQGRGVSDEPRVVARVADAASGRAVASDAGMLDRALGGVARWTARAARGALMGRGAAPSRGLLAALDAAVARLAPIDRLAWGPVLSEVRGALCRPLPAGVEEAVRALGVPRPATLATWMEGARPLLAGARAPTGDAAGPWVVRALLLVTPCGRARSDR